MTVAPCRGSMCGRRPLPEIEGVDTDGIPFRLRLTTDPFGRCDPDTRVTLWDHTDADIARMLRDGERATSDGARSAPPSGVINEYRAMLKCRLKLRIRYGASFEGTDHYDCYMRHGAAPSYRLALAIDEAKARRGLRHCLNWSTILDGAA